MTNRKKNRKVQSQNAYITSTQPCPFQYHGYHASPYLIDFFANKGIFPNSKRADGKFEWNVLLLGTSDDLYQDALMRESYLVWKSTLPKTVRLQPITEENKEKLVMEFVILEQHGIVKFPPMELELVEVFPSAGN